MNFNIMEMAKELEIKRVIIIDDDLPNNDMDLQKVDDAFKDYKRENKRTDKYKDFKDNNFNEKEIKIIDSDEYQIDAENDLNTKIYKFLINKEYIYLDNQNHQLEALTNFLNKELSEIELIQSNRIDEKITLADKDLIIIDVNLDKQHENLKGYTVIDKIKKAISRETEKAENKESSSDLFRYRNFNYILFISSKYELELNEEYGEIYNLRVEQQKNEFFRMLRKEFSAYEFVVFNFLHKDLLIEEVDLKNEISKILYEFSITKTFFKFLNGLSSKIEQSKEIVFNDFYSLNMATLKHIIEDNIVYEGISEFEFFNDLICKLINKENSQADLIKVIHEYANEIKEWDEPIIQYHLDKNLLEIREKELYKNVNSCFEPVQFGDIFKFDLDNEENQNLLLISQQCDMTIRSDGERAAKNLTMLKDYKKKGCFFKIERYEEKEKKPSAYYWYKREPLILPADILDLCSLNSEGFCKMNIRDHYVPNFDVLLTEAHKKRIENFYYKLTEEIRNIEAIVDSVKKTELKRRLRYVIINDIAVRYNIDDEKNVDFGIKRIKRLDDNVTKEIQQEYVNQLNRIGQPISINAKSAKDIQLVVKISGCDCNKLKAKTVGSEFKNQYILINYNECMKLLNKFSKAHKFLDISSVIDQIEKYALEPFYFQGDETKFIRIDAEDIEELKNNNININENKIEINLDNEMKLSLDTNYVLTEDECFIKSIDSNKLGLFVLEKYIEYLKIDHNNLNLKQSDIIMKQKEKKYVNLNSSQIKNLINYSFSNRGELIVRRCSTN